MLTNQLKKQDLYTNINMIHDGVTKQKQQKMLFFICLLHSQISANSQCNYSYYSQHFKTFCKLKHFQSLENIISSKLPQKWETKHLWQNKWTNRLTKSSFLSLKMVSNKIKTAEISSITVYMMGFILSYFSCVIKEVCWKGKEKIHPITK